MEYLDGLASDSVPQNPPFKLNGETGSIVTTMDMEFVTEERFRFGVRARDNPGQSNNQRTTDGDVIVSVNRKIFTRKFLHFVFIMLHVFIDDKLGILCCVRYFN